MHSFLIAHNSPFYLVKHNEHKRKRFPSRSNSLCVFTTCQAQIFFINSFELLTTSCPMCNMYFFWLVKNRFALANMKSVFFTHSPVVKAPVIVQGESSTIACQLEKGKMVDAVNVCCGHTDLLCFSCRQESRRKYR